MRLDTDKFIKILGMSCTLAGAVLGMVSSEKEKIKLIDEAVKKHFANENK